MDRAQDVGVIEVEVKHYVPALTSSVRPDIGGVAAPIAPGGFRKYAVPALF